MWVACLGSGSKGNAFLVGEEEQAILIDAGFSFRSLQKRMTACAIPWRSLQAILITHEHIDHIRGLKVLAKHWEGPIFASPGTANFLEADLPQVQGFDGSLSLNRFSIEAFPVPHDAVNPVGFVIENHQGTRIGIALDVGHFSLLVSEALKACDYIVLEANHDTNMLWGGPYAWSLKQRIASSKGHLSNEEVVEHLPRILGKPRGIMLGHLSKVNNSPELLHYSICTKLQDLRYNIPFIIASQDQVIPPREV